MENPKKNLPKAIIIIILVVSLLYVLIQIVTIGILGPTQAAQSTVPIQDAFTKIAGNFGKSLVAAGTLLSTGGLLIASSYVTPRSGVALAENNMLPTAMGLRNKKDAPYVSILVSMIIVLIIAWSGTFSKLALISAISRFAQYIPTCLAVLIFIRRKKDTKDNFHLPFGWLIPVIAIIVSLWLLIQVKADQLIWGLGALITAIPFYFITGTHKKNKCK